MYFWIDFGAEDAGRLSPFEDDNPKDAENTVFRAGSDNSCQAKVNIDVIIIKLAPSIFSKIIFLNLSVPQKAKLFRRNVSVVCADIIVWTVQNAKAMSCITTLCRV